jgi:alkylation response protein AidB-like acyl-CoA dehydrogenase
MDFQWSEEETAVAELARQILVDQATNERLKEVEKKPLRFDAELWKRLADANLLGVAIPEAHGGMALGFQALCLFMQEIGRAVAPVPAYPSLVLGALPLARFGTEAEHAAWLPRLASGDAILTTALVELESSDPLRPATRAEAANGSFRLHGEKSLVPSAQQAERILVPARLDGGEVAIFFVDPGADGVTVSAQQSSDGQPNAFVALDGVVVGEEAALGGLEGGAERLRWLVERATTARCAMQLGVIERALEMTAKYANERIQFDRPIGSFQAVHQRAADAYIQVEAVRLATWEAIWRLASGLESSDAVAVAKYWAAEGGHFAAFACQHLHGGIGIDVDYPLHRYFIWAIQIEHELGSAPHQLDRLGERIATLGAEEYG